MKKRIFYIAYLLLCITACTEKFDPHIPGTSTNNLVVEGFANTNGSTVIRLSRTAKLNDANLKPEPAAKVQIEGEDNKVFPLTESDKGVYFAANLNLSQTAKYRLRIKTSDGKEYLSDFSEAKKTQPIDNVNWKRDDKGVQISVSTHDPQNNTRYYMWDFEETWKYISYIDTRWKWDQTQQKVVERPDNEHIYTCWANFNSTNIILASTAKLSQDIISSKPLINIPPRSVKLSVRYSVLVKQYALSREAYEFYSLMERNTEGNGSVFDSQPSELKGNIYCLSNPGEGVIGYFSVCNREEKRIYINRSELIKWGDSLECYDEIVPGIWEGQEMLPNGPKTINWVLGGVPPGPANYPKYPDPQHNYDLRFLIPWPSPPEYIPITSLDEPANTEWIVMLARCVDCRLKGGKLTKPAFWVD